MGCSPQVLYFAPDGTVQDYDAYAYPDEISSTTLYYRSPGAVVSPKTEAEAEKLAGAVRASMPFFLPFRDASVYPAAGWFYGGGSLHAAVDFLKTADQYGPGIDPTIEVHAVADGQVRSAHWDDWAGNVLIIEHTAPNGDRYQSLYCHMRNGYSHDLAAAQAINPPDPKATDNWTKYSAFAHNPKYQNHLLWGTEQQTIQVKAGDTVYAGQLLGWSGNTGAGGAGNGLQDNGEPWDPNTANNHLHLFAAVPDAGRGGDNWVLIDPYGVYRQASEADGSSCYDLGKGVAFVRLFAPFLQSFHNVPAAILIDYWGYYTGMGMALQTVSVYWSGGQLLAAGSFQAGLSSDWYALLYQTAGEFQNEFDQGVAKGYVPREIGVALDPDGSPRFSAIWRPRGNDAYYAYNAMSDDDLNAKWQELVVKGKMRVGDYAGYEAGGVRQHAAIFVGDGDGAFYLYHDLAPSGFQTKFDELYAQHFYPVSVNAAERSSGASFAAVWRPLASGTATWINLSAQDYQDKYLALVGGGARLLKVQGYGNGDLFAAIWA